jgi:hypothetical protein
MKKERQLYARSTIALLLEPGHAANFFALFFWYSGQQEGGVRLCQMGTF